MTQFQLPSLLSLPTFPKYLEMTTDEVPGTYDASETDKKDIRASNPEDSANRDLDTEEKHGYGESHQLPELQRRLKSRHLQMIAMGKHPKCIFFS